jgi:chromosome partitioning protein
MSIPTVAFFNNKGGVGKTSLVYHLAWKYSDMGVRVLAMDLDPQASLTSAFLGDDGVEELLGDGKQRSIFGTVEPLKKSRGDMKVPHLEELSPTLALIPGDLRLASFEEDLSQAWAKCLDGVERAFRVTSAFWRVMQEAGQAHEAELILIDLGPNCSAINRAALISADFVVLPLGAACLSMTGLASWGYVLEGWENEWHNRLDNNPNGGLALPEGTTHPLGYVFMQHSVRLDLTASSHENWIRDIPTTYRNVMLRLPREEIVTVHNDEHCLGLVKHYRSLMEMARESRKPIFHLASADGAIGAHLSAALDAGKDFQTLATRIKADVDKAVAAREAVHE